MSRIAANSLQLNSSPAHVFRIHVTVPHLLLAPKLGVVDQNTDTFVSWHMPSANGLSQLQRRFEHRLFTVEALRSEFYRHRQRNRHRLWTLFHPTRPIKSIVTRTPFGNNCNCHRYHEASSVAHPCLLPFRRILIFDPTRSVSDKYRFRNESVRRGCLRRRFQGIHC